MPAYSEPIEVHIEDALTAFNENLALARAYLDGCAATRDNYFDATRVALTCAIAQVSQIELLAAIQSGKVEITDV